MIHNQFEPILLDLHRKTFDLQESAIVATDGIPLCTMLNHGTNPDRVGGMSSALLSLGIRAAKELSVGNMKQVVIDGDNGFILMVQATDDCMLVMTAKADAKLGMMLFNARDTVKEIQKVVQSA